MIQTLRRNFDFVVIDTPPGFDDQVLGAFDETDECIIVATLDVPTIKNTKVAIETLDLLHLVPNNRHLVLNRADEEVGLSQANVEDILGMKVVRRRCPARPPWPAPPTTAARSSCPSRTTRSRRPSPRSPGRSAAEPSAPSRLSPPSAACSGARRSLGDSR